MTRRRERYDKRVLDKTLEGYTKDIKKHAAKKARGATPRDTRQPDGPPAHRIKLTPGTSGPLSHPPQKDPFIRIDPPVPPPKARPKRKRTVTPAKKREAEKASERVLPPSMGKPHPISGRSLDPIKSYQPPETQPNEVEAFEGVLCPLLGTGCLGPGCHWYVGLECAVTALAKTSSTQVGQMSSLLKLLADFLIHPG